MTNDAFNIGDDILSDDERALGRGRLALFAPFPSRVMPEIRGIESWGTNKAAHIVAGAMPDNDMRFF